MFGKWHRYVIASLSLSLSFLTVPHTGKPRDSAKALELLLSLANKNYPKALYTLGIWYEYGFGDVEQNEHKAFEYYYRAAKEGHKKALQKVRVKYMKSPDYWARVATAVTLTVASVAVLVARRL